MSRLRNRTSLGFHGLSTCRRVATPYHERVDVQADFPVLFRPPFIGGESQKG